MNKIVLMSNQVEKNKTLVSWLKFFFPEAEVEIVPKCGLSHISRGQAMTGNAGPLTDIEIGKDNIGKKKRDNEVKFSF